MQNGGPNIHNLDTMKWKMTSNDNGHVETCLRTLVPRTMLTKKEPGKWSQEINDCDCGISSLCAIAPRSTCFSVQRVSRSFASFLCHQNLHAGTARTNIIAILTRIAWPSSPWKDRRKERWLCVWRFPRRVSSFHVWLIGCPSLYFLSWWTKPSLVWYCWVTSSHTSTKP